jgi:hypothetical protein
MRSGTDSAGRRATIGGNEDGSSKWTTSGLPNVAAQVEPIYRLPDWDALIVDVMLHGEDADVAAAVSWTISRRIGPDQLDEWLRAAARRIFGEYAYADQVAWLAAQAILTLACSDPRTRRFLLRSGPDGRTLVRHTDRLMRQCPVRRSITRTPRRRGPRHRRTRRATRAGPADDSGEGEPASAEVGG